VDLGQLSQRVLNQLKAVFKAAKIAIEKLQILEDNRKKLVGYS